MLKRRIFASAAAVLGRIKGRAAAAKAFCDALEARVSAQRIIVSDVFGADTFVSRSGTTETSMLRARWDDGLQFEPAQHAVPVFSSDDESRSPPAFLTATRKEPFVKPVSGDDTWLFRGVLPTLICAGILLIAWITAGRSGTFAEPSRADAIAEQFSGGGEGSLMVSRDLLTAASRLEFAPRFALFYADLLSKDGVCGEADALDTMQSAASVTIRNLPLGTVLSAGEQVSATAWKLKPEEVHAIVVKIPADHSVPIQAKIETHDASGGVLGQMAVEIRETGPEPSLGAAYRRKPTRPSKSATAKRRPSDAYAQQIAKKPAAAVAVPAAQPANPTPQSLLSQLPFFPGAYDKNAAPETTVGQQILINLGVIPAPPTATALTQSN